MTVPSRSTQDRASHQIPSSTYRENMRNDLEREIDNLKERDNQLVAQIYQIQDTIEEKQRELDGLTVERVRVVKETLDNVPGYLYTRPIVCMNDIRESQAQKTELEDERKEIQCRLARIKERLEHLW